jgi:hypothetical protein
VIATERLFTMSSFEGLRLIRKRLLEGPGSPVELIVSEIQLTEPDAPGLDLEAACELHGLVDSCELDGTIFYRHCIRGVVLSRLPGWIKLMRLGRLAFASKLDNKDDYTIFESAGLLDGPPTADVVLWWDTIGHEVKLGTDLEKMEQARAAEQLSWEIEKARLVGLGIEADPIRMGVDDNRAGFDVLSYEPGVPTQTNKLIEVKSCATTPLRYFVTRNEWRKALKSKEAYFFHIWDMQKSPPVLHIRTVAQVEPHIPSDNGKGIWSNVEVPVGSATT